MSSIWAISETINDLQKHNRNQDIAISKRNGDEEQLLLINSNKSETNLITLFKFPKNICCIIL